MLNGGDFYFPSRLKRYFHPKFGRYLDKAFGLSNKGIFGHKLRQ